MIREAEKYDAREMEIMMIAPPDRISTSSPEPESQPDMSALPRARDDRLDAA